MIDGNDVRISEFEPPRCAYNHCALPARFCVASATLKREYRACGRHRLRLARFLGREFKLVAQRAKREARAADKRAAQQSAMNEAARRALRRRIKAAGPSYPLVFGPSVSMEQREQIMTQLAERG